MNNLDEKISSAIANAVRRSRLASFFAQIGASHVIWLMLGAGYAIAAFGSSIYGAPFQLMQTLTFMLFVAWIITFGLEHLFHRRRPFEQSTNQPLIDMLLKTPSFPSGHATISFAIASYMLLTHPPLFPLFLIAAIYVSLSRVAVGVHYLTDVIVGAIIGSAVPWMLVYLAFYVFH